jgi:uncharacterized damage-inducible protein DinB
MSTTVTSNRAVRPTPDEYAPYYGRYVARVGEGDVVAILHGQLSQTLGMLRGIPEAQGGHRYAPDKWSIRECIGHLADAERIFAYRALRFSRNDSTALHGFDENAFVANASFDGRTLASLCDEFEATRRSTIALFDSLTQDEWSRRGTASENPVSVRALAWIIAGHELHHVEVLRTRYLQAG